MIKISDSARDRLLQIMSKEEDEKKNQLKVKRKQKFITDKYGFRNSKVDLSESDLILVGDSQISGSSLTDEFLLSSELN